LEPQLHEKYQMLRPGVYLLREEQRLGRLPQQLRPRHPL